MSNRTRPISSGVLSATPNFTSKLFALTTFDKLKANDRFSFAKHSKTECIITDSLDNANRFFSVINQRFFVINAPKEELAKIKVLKMVDNIKGYKPDLIIIDDLKK